MAFPTTGVLDNFNRADTGPPLSSSWTDDALGEGANNQTKVVSNTAKAHTASTSCESYYNASTFSGSVEVYATVATKPGNGQRFDLGFLQSPGSAAVDGYQARFDDAVGTDTIKILRIDNQVNTQLGATISLEWTTSDVLGLRLAAGVLDAFVNGTSQGNRSDSTYTGAFYLFLCIRDTTGALDDFGGGVVAIPNKKLIINQAVNRAAVW